jgi:hypothetical protein
MLLHRCYISDAYCAVDFEARENPEASLEMVLSRVFDNQFAGIRVCGAGSIGGAVVDRSEISDNGVYGVLCEGDLSSVAITGDTIARNATAAVCIRQTSETQYSLCSSRFDGDYDPPEERAPYGIVLTDLGAEVGIQIGPPNYIWGFDQAAVLLENVNTEDCNIVHNSIHYLNNDGIVCSNTVPGSPRVRDCYFAHMVIAVYADETSLPDLGTVAPLDSGLGYFRPDVCNFFVYNGNTAPIYAQYNYWGALEPDPDKFIGVGDVIYTPWLTSPPGGGEQSAGEEEGPTADAGLSVAPNPFAQTARLCCQVPRQSVVSLRVFDITGRVVRDIHHGLMAEGEHVLSWDGADNSGKRVSAGVYLCVFESDHDRQTQRLVLTD